MAVLLGLVHLLPEHRAQPQHRCHLDQGRPDRHPGGARPARRCSRCCSAARCSAGTSTRSAATPRQPAGPASTWPAIRLLCFVLCSTHRRDRRRAARQPGQLGHPQHRRWRDPAVRGRRGRHRRHQPVRRQGPAGRRDHRRPGGRGRRQRHVPAQQVGCRGLHGHRSGAAARGGRGRALPASVLRPPGAASGPHDGPCSGCARGEVRRRPARQPVDAAPLRARARADRPQPADRRPRPQPQHHRRADRRAGRGRAGPRGGRPADAGRRSAAAAAGPRYVVVAGDRARAGAGGRRRGHAPHGGPGRARRRGPVPPGPCHRPRPHSRGRGRSRRHIAKIGAALLAEVGDAVVVAAGVAVPGMVRRHDGQVRQAPNLGWRDVPLGHELAEALRAAGRRRQRRRPGDPRRARARGRRRGRRRGLPVRALRTSGRGSSPAAARSAAAPATPARSATSLVNPDGLPCHCGSHGCWETECGEERLFELAGRPAGGGLAGVREVVAAAAEGDVRRRRGSAARRRPGSAGAPPTSSTSSTPRSSSWAARSRRCCWQPATTVRAEFEVDRAWPRLVRAGAAGRAPARRRLDPARCRRARLRRRCCPTRCSSCRGGPPPRHPKSRPPSRRETTS